jgi:hypothetical protein
MSTNIFISHIHEDDPHIEPMKSLLGEHGYDVRDSSIDSSNPNRANNPDYIKTQILAPAIDWAGTVLVLVSPETCRSEWVNWEIRYAQEQGKRIVGVYAPGATESDIPEALEDYGTAVVGWQAASIVDAINGAVNQWESSDGGRRPARDITRIVCQTR